VKSKYADRYKKLDDTGGSFEESIRVTKTQTMPPKRYWGISTPKERPSTSKEAQTNSLTTTFGISAPNEGPSTVPTAQVKAPKTYWGISAPKAKPKASGASPKRAEENPHDLNTSLDERKRR
jgi:hypothetical protein